MMGRVDCARAERLAGTIALAEASDEQRDLYRAHLAGCQRCVDDLGGEREIERTIAVVARARDAESWEPDFRAAFAKGKKRRFAWIYGAVLAVAAVVALAGGRLMQAPQSAAPAAHAISSQEAQAIAALNTQTAPRREGRAESLKFGSPALSTSIVLRVDGRGEPMRCTIAHSSGDPALDESICRTAMHARYLRR
ncbi:MAG: hypothetical protein JO113_02980 [Candidatus Eremiobacteraeota bacterium]|nr:hypothetical protein [Candidatus Eremiobacteraeota bacterium]